MISGLKTDSNLFFNRINNNGNIDYNELYNMHGGYKGYIRDREITQGRLVEI